MLGHTHALIGVTTVVGAQALTGFMEPHLIQDIPTGVVLNISVGIIGALLPDIDANESSIKRELGFAGEITQATLRMIGVKHRGATHFGITGLLFLFTTTFTGRYLGYSDLGLAYMCIHDEYPLSTMSCQTDDIPSPSSDIILSDVIYIRIIHRKEIRTLSHFKI